MQCKRGRRASKRIRGETQAETKDVRGKPTEKPRIAKEQERGGLGTDRDLLHSTIHTVGGDRSERKGNFLDGGSNIREFFVDFRSSLGNLMGRIS